MGDNLWRLRELFGLFAPLNSQMNPLFSTAPAFPSRLEASAEAELLRRARDGDRDAIGVLYARFRDRMVSLAFGVLRDHQGAEDAAQEVLLRAFDKMPVLHSESEFSSWLYRLALNLCLDRKRALLRRAGLLERAPETPRTIPSPAARIETRLALEGALDELDESSRMILMLREWHELSYDEIAAVLQIPLGTVRSRLSAARREFRRVWEEQDAE